MNIYNPITALIIFFVIAIVLFSFLDLLRDGIGLLKKTLEVVKRLLLKIY